jgi:tRNA threonylcarbamoyladenosine biosynthesis protein TsaB
LLAIDLSADLASVALVCRGADGDSWFEENAPGGVCSSANLILSIELALAKAGLQIDGVSQLAFGAGPGAFTGVRTAAAVIQGLAVVTGLPVIPVGTLEALAFSVFAERDDIQRVAAVTDARMGEVYFAMYERACLGASMVDQVPPLVAPPEQVWESYGWLLESGACLVGAIGMLPRAPCLGIERLMTARRVAEWALHQSQAAVDAALAQPAYVRNKVAQTTAERALARAAARLQITET